MRWSCGNTRSILAGDRLFMMKQGDGVRGIIGSGFATGSPGQGPHFVPSLRRRGKKAWYVDAVFDELIDPDVTPPLPVHLEEDGPLAGVHWGAQASGIRVKEPAATELELRWAAHMRRSVTTMDQLDEGSAREGEVTRRMVAHRYREVRLRAEKLQSAAAASPDGRLRCEVVGCGFDFEERYGHLGRGFAHVHHLVPLHKLRPGSRTTLRDLIVVCPNCHAMIHRGGECRKPATLIPNTLRQGNTPKRRRARA